MARGGVGYLPEDHRFPLYHTGGSLLYFYGALSRTPANQCRPRIRELMARLEMSDWTGTKIRKYSKGMLQRLGLAAALVNDPDLIFLDEPTDGVDPLGRRAIRDLLLELKEKVVDLAAELPVRPAVAEDEDLILALINLGYRRKDAEMATAAARDDNPDAAFHDLLRASLKRLSRA